MSTVLDIVTLIALGVVTYVTLNSASNQQLNELSERLDGLFEKLATLDEVEGTALEAFPPQNINLILTIDTSELTSALKDFQQLCNQLKDKV